MKINISDTHSKSVEEISYGTTIKWRDEYWLIINCYPSAIDRESKRMGANLSTGEVKLIDKKARVIEIFTQLTL